MSDTVYGITKTSDPVMDVVHVSDWRYAFRRHGYVVYSGTFEECKKRMTIADRNNDVNMRRALQAVHLKRVIS